MKGTPLDLVIASLEVILRVI